MLPSQSALQEEFLTAVSTGRSCEAEAKHSSSTAEKASPATSAGKGASKRMLKATDPLSLPWVMLQQKLVYEWREASEATEGKERFKAF